MTAVRLNKLSGDVGGGRTQQKFNDGSNFFGPNPAAVEGMLLDAGFARVTRFDPWSTNTWYSIAPPSDEPTGVVDKVRRRVQQRFGRARSGRMVFHAHV